jgi:uncharacterized membrane protein
MPDISAAWFNIAFGAVILYLIGLGIAVFIAFVFLVLAGFQIRDTSSSGQRLARDFAGVSHAVFVAGLEWPWLVVRETGKAVIDGLHLIFEKKLEG